MRHGRGDTVEREVERLIGKRGSGCGACDFACDARRRLGGPFDGGAAEPTRRCVARTGEQSVAAEPGTDSTTCRTRGGGDTGTFPILNGDVVAVAYAQLQEFGADLQAALFERLGEGPVQCGTRSGFGRRAGQHADDQFLDRHANGDLGGHSKRYGARGADPGPRGRQQWRHLDREDDHRADDHELGLLDIGCAVTDLVGHAVEIFDQARPGAFLAHQLVPVFLDRVMGSAVDRGQYLLDGVVRVVVDVVERRRHPRPGIGDPPHGGLVTFGPIACPDNPFGDPLQGFGDLDAHQRGTWPRSPALAWSRFCSASATATTRSPRLFIVVPSLSTPSKAFGTPGV